MAAIFHISYKYLVIVNTCETIVKTPKARWTAGEQVE